MHLGEKLTALHVRFGKLVEVRERVRIFGFLPWTQRGWLCIEDRTVHWRVTYADPRTGPGPDDQHTIVAEVHKHNGEPYFVACRGNGTWLKELPTDRRPEARPWFERLCVLVDLAYAYHIVRPWVAKPDIIPSVRR